MKKDECEGAIRHLCGEWRRQPEQRDKLDSQLYFSDFLTWTRREYPRYLNFRSAISAEYDAELWFDEEFGQTWKR
jgi:hypothetical protein